MLAAKQNSGRLQRNSLLAKRIEDIWLIPPPHGLTALVGLDLRIFWGFEITLIHTTLDKTSLDKLSVRRRDLYMKHSIHAHDSGGIWTRNSSNGAAADPRRRPCGHRDRTSEGLVTVISKPLLQLLYLWNVLFKKFKRSSLNDSSVTTLVLK